MSLSLTQQKVLSIETVNNDGIMIGIEKRMPFVAGQVVGLTLDLNVAPRLYSITSGEADNTLEVFFTVKEGGVLTPQLAQLVPGEMVYVTPPHGKFGIDEDKGKGKDRAGWWIATGTGIAPFRSMYRSGYRPAKLIQGGRTYDELFFVDEFGGGKNHLKFVTQESHPNAQHMRLTQYLEQHDGLPTNETYFICGNPNMVVDVRNLLVDKGIPFDRIVTEIYF
jgi:ferredoxin--NADP+ reductase